MLVVKLPNAPLRRGKHSQKGEEAFLLGHFKNASKGFVVDVGAADGEVNSNSYALLNYLGWGGLLIEPLPSYYGKLCALYKDRPDIHLSNKAVWETACMRDMHIFGDPRTEHAQVSTISPDFRKRVVRIHGDKFTGTVPVECAPLGDILRETHCPKKIDFLDIDCEGSDLHALSSIDLTEFDVGLISVELSMAKSLVEDILGDAYIFLSQIGGNGFWIKAVKDV